MQDRKRESAPLTRSACDGSHLPSSSSVHSPSISSSLLSLPPISTTEGSLNADPCPADLDDRRHSPPATPSLSLATCPRPPLGGRWRWPSTPTSAARIWTVATESATRRPSRGSVEWSHGGAVRAESARAWAKKKQQRGSLSVPAASSGRTTRAKARSSST